MSGIVIGEGRFRVDRKLALEKMEKFQLEDPYRYVLELVAAAVCGGAETITITNDSDDFVIAWTGVLPGRHELDGLFDALFGHPEDLRQHVLQHLAVGTLGALGLEPRWLRIDRGPVGDETGLRLEVRDPTETVTVDHHEDLDGMRVSVREQLGGATLAEALTLLFRPPLEARLIQGAARWCPVPIRINGTPMPTGAPAGAIAGAPCASGHLWLEEATEGVVDMVRHGIVVGHRPGRGLGPFTVSGWLRDDSLRLNASRSAVVEDERWRRYLGDVASAVDTFVAGLFEGDTLPPGIAERIAFPALEHLQCRPLGALGAVPVLVDAVGRKWSANELRTLVPPPGISSGPVDPGDPRPVFVGDTARLVRALCPQAVDRTAELGSRVKGRQRRELASRVRMEPFFPNDAVQRRFQSGALAGSVRLAPSTTAGAIRVSVRIAGTELRTLELPGPGPAMLAILDHPGFEADAGYEDLVRDTTWDTATATLRAEANAHLLDLLRQDVEVRGVWILVTCLGPAPPRADLRARIKNLDPAMWEVRALLTGTGQRLSVRAVAEAETEWVVLERLPAGTPPELAARVLLLPPSVSGHWARWLGGADSKSFLDDVSRAHRLAGNRRPATFEGRETPTYLVRVAADGVTGVLGLHAHEAPHRVTLLRRGVFVRDVELAVGVPGLQGVLDVPDLEVDRAHADVATPAVLTALAARLAPSIEALVTTVWDETRFPRRPLPAWLFGWLAANRKRWSDAVRERPIGTWADGRIATLAQISRRVTGKKKAKVGFVEQPPPPGLGFDDLLVADSNLRQLLTAWIPNNTRDASPDVRQAETARAAFLLRPLAPPIPALAERTVALAEGVEVRYVVPRDPETAGRLRLEARWSGRVLTTRIANGFGPTVVLESAADHTFTTVRDPERFDLTKEAPDIAVDLLLEVLSRPVRREDTPVWLALRKELTPISGNRAALRVAIDAAVRLDCLDGQARTIAELTAEPRVVRVAADLAAGPSPFPVAVRSGPGVALAIPGWRDETATVVKWRELQLQRRSLPRRSAVLTGTVLRRARFHHDEVTGELGITGVDGPAGLVIEPLVDGIALQTITVPFPAPMRAILDGLVADADPDFAALRTGAPERAHLPPEALHRLRAAAHALARAAVEQRGDDPELSVWVQLYVLGDPASRGAAVFPVLGGGSVSREALDQRREAWGGIAVVERASSRPLPAGPQPIVASRLLRAALEKLYTVVDLDPVVLRAGPPSGPRPAVPVRIALPRRGEVGFVTAADGVEIRIGDLGLGKLAPSWPVPLGGWIEDPALVPTLGWDGVADGPAVDALRAELVLLSRAATALLADRGGAAEVLASALRRLTATPDAVRASVRGTSSDPLVARLAEVQLFEDATGRSGTVVDLVAQRPIRAVSKTTRANPAPGRSRFWRLDSETRAWLGLAERVIDAEEAAALEQRGHERRTGARWRRPVHPPSAELVRGGGVEGVVWLGALTDTVVVLVGGREVMALPLPVKGVTGYIEGDWPTDDGFAEADVPRAVLAEVERRVGVLLQREADFEPTRFAPRLAASAAPNRLPPVLRGVVLPGGSLAQIADELARYKHLVFHEPGDPDPALDRRVLPRETRELLEVAFPKAKFVRASAVVTKKSRTEERRAEGIARDARRTRDAVSVLAEAWAGPELRASVRKEVAGWAWTPPAWFARVDVGAEIAVAAWAAVAEVAAPEVELQALERLVDALAD